MKVSILLAASFSSFALAQDVSTVGNTGCQCIDTSPLLNLISDCFVDGPTGQRGVIVNNACYPLTYGSNYCAPHDQDVDPFCLRDNPPAFCSNPWCYVNATECHNSEEYYFKSFNFDEKKSSKASALDATAEEVTLFYSYSTCNSSAEDWRTFATTEATSRRPLTVVIPGVVSGDHYKLNSAGELVDWDGAEAFDNSIPWQGWIVDYFNTLVKDFSNIPGVTYIHRSKGSKTKFPSSSWTQAVTDVEAGVADLGIAAFWITSDRLNLAPFTVPVATDSVKIWIKQPEINEGNVQENFEKLLRPFSKGLWALLAASIILYALFSVVLSPERFRVYETKPDDSRAQKLKQGALMIGDSINISFLEFLGGNVDYWTVSGEAQKILNVGFALVVFISVAAYTANLAAFLTIANAKSYISNIDEAIAQNAFICTWSSLRSDLEAIYPGAKWVYLNDDAEIFENYDQERCSLIVRGYVDVPGSPALQEAFCSRDMVYMPIPVLEKAVGFPASDELVGGLSYWISEAANQGITMDYFLSQQELQCALEVQIDGGNYEEDLTQLTPANMVLPLMIYAICVLLAGSWHVGAKVHAKREAANNPNRLEGAEETAQRRVSVNQLRMKTGLNSAAFNLPFTDEVKAEAPPSPRFDPNYQQRASTRHLRMQSFRQLQTGKAWGNSDPNRTIAQLEETTQKLFDNQFELIEKMKQMSKNEELDTSLRDL